MFDCARTQVILVDPLCRLLPPAAACCRLLPPAAACCRLPTKVTTGCCLVAHLSADSPATAQLFFSEGMGSTIRPPIFFFGGQVGRPVGWSRWSTCTPVVLEEAAPWPLPTKVTTGCCLVVRPGRSVGCPPLRFFFRVGGGVVVAVGRLKKKIGGWLADHHDPVLGLFEFYL